MDAKVFELGTPEQLLQLELSTGPMSHWAQGERLWPMGHRLTWDTMTPAVRAHAEAEAASGVDPLWIFNGFCALRIPPALQDLWLHARTRAVWLEDLWSALANGVPLDPDPFRRPQLWPLATGMFLRWPLDESYQPWTYDWDTVAVVCHDGFPNPAPDVFSTEELIGHPVLLSDFADLLHRLTGVSTSTAQANLTHMFRDEFWSHDAVTAYLWKPGRWWPCPGMLPNLGIVPPI